MNINNIKSQFPIFSKKINGKSLTYLDSSNSSQKPISVINRLNDYLLEKIKVDFIFLNLVNMKNLKLRLSKRKNLNRYDNFKISFYKKIQNGFIKITKENKKKYLLINSNDPINKNKKIILDKISKLLGL